MANVLVCVSGSVAGIKVPALVAGLAARGADVRLAASQKGLVFLSASPDRGSLACDIYRDESSGWEEGDEPLFAQLADWADLVLFAPLSANTLAKLALGLSDSLIAKIARAWDSSPQGKPMLVAPAMNTKMWSHPVTVAHLAALTSRGVVVISPVTKVLACGDYGVGAMASVDTIVHAVLSKRPAAETTATSK